MRTTYLSLALILTVALSACGSDTYHEGGTNTVYVTVTPTPAGPVDEATAVQNDINAIVADENAYRQGLGQTELTPGLSCALYKITGGQYIQNDSTHTPTITGASLVTTFRFTGSFNQENSSVNDGLNVLPENLRSNPNYKNLILLRCTGFIVNTLNYQYDFSVASDDGSVLYLDGSRLIDNDGNHGITEKFGTKYLRRGVHAFRLDYAQTGSGAQALILKANGGLIPGAVYFH